MLRIAMRSIAALMIAGLVLLGGLSMAMVSAAEPPQPPVRVPDTSASTGR